MGLSENLVEIKSEVEALTTYANETTGASDETLSDAVASLVAGYGGGGSTYPFLPVGAELIHADDVVWNLATDTTYNDITPSTSTNVIRSPGQARGWYALTSDMENYEYLFYACACVDPVYDTQASIGYNTKIFVSSRSTFGFIENGGVLSLASDISQIMGTTFINNAGNLSITPSAYYGIYPSAVSGNVQSTSNKKSVIGVTYPQINCRANNTYASSDCFSHLIAEQTTITLRLEVYRYPKENGSFAKTIATLGG